jgi:hypothetical protein
VFAALIDEGPLPERGADHLGNNPVGAYWASAASSRRLRPSRVLERSYPGPLGRATGAELLQIRLYDLLAPGWDIMQANVIRAQIPEELAAKPRPTASPRICAVRRKFPIATTNMRRSNMPGYQQTAAH